jgi:hypothetical protein
MTPVVAKIFPHTAPHSYQAYLHGLRNHPMLPSSELKMSKTNKNINISSNYK